MTEAEVDDDEPSEARRGFGTLGSVLHLLVVAWAAILAVLPLNDNSFFTHLATGRLILERGSVPSVDPYSFTARGEAWTVQSWLASVAYATAEQLGGIVGLRLLLILVYVVAGSLVWRLTSAVTSLIPRLVLAAGAMAVCTGVWSERPYMVGFIGLALVWLALEGRINPWWLVPCLWIWGNTHGSFPLALLLAATVAVGSAIDQHGGSEPVDVRRELLVLRSVVIGMVLAVASPLGLRALTFPLAALARSDTFGLIVEWQAPRFTSASERVFLLLLLATVVSVVVQRRWRQVLPALAFMAAALLAQRNVVMAVPVLVPIVAVGVPRLGTLESRTRPATGRPLAALAAALVALVVVAGLRASGIGLGGYPTRPLAFVAQRNEHTLVTQDFTANLLEVLDGTDADVFMDDRVDMFPDEVVEDYDVLNSGRPGWDRVLDEHGASALVWSRADPLASLVAADPRWRIALSDAEWVLAVRRD